MTILYDTQSLLERGLTKLVRNPTLFVTNLVEPLFFLLIFSQMLQKLSVFLPNESGGYLAYLTPGVVMLSAMITSPQSGVSIANDLNSGFLSKMLLTQVSRPAILLGRLLTDMSMVVAQSLITIIVAIAMGVRISSGLPGIRSRLGDCGGTESISSLFLVRPPGLRLERVCVPRSRTPNLPSRT